MPSEKVAGALSRLGIDVPVSEFGHYGVPGMKWGVRRSSSELAGNEDGGGGGGDTEELEAELDDAEKALMNDLVKQGWKKGVDKDRGLYVSAEHMSGRKITEIMGKQLGRGFGIKPGKHQIFLKRDKKAVERQKTPKKAVENFIEDIYAKK